MLSNGKLSLEFSRLRYLFSTKYSFCSYILSIGRATGFRAKETTGTATQDDD